MAYFLIVVFMHLGYDGGLVVKEFNFGDVESCEFALAKVMELGGEFARVNTLVVKGVCVYKAGSLKGRK